MAQSAQTATRRAMRNVPRAAGWRPRLLAVAPLAVVALTLLLVGRAEYYKHGYQDLLGFAALGSNYSQHIGITHGFVSDVGYDGQFFYYLALDPGLVVTCAHTASTCPLDYQPLVRLERILYPMTARLLALGQPGLIPLSLLLVNFLAILVTAALLGRLSVEAGASRWLGAAAALYAGETLAFARDLADPFATMWLVLAVFLAQRGRWLWAAMAVAAALLAREQLLLVAPLIGLPLLAERRWRLLSGFVALGLGPFVAWQLVLRALYGVWPLLAGDTRAASVTPLPFGGLWPQRGAGDFKLEVLVVAVPLVAGAMLAVWALRRQGWRAILGEPIPAMALWYAL
ncbi:MAG TPA: hypothetical protein VFU88_21395, partial [Ktedonobacterales bacterium]|nr:hypothetical protein [Ktedonobacterales bacterium]